MKIALFLLCGLLLLLAGAMRVVVFVANQQRKRLFSDYRNITHMSPTSPPQVSLNRWGYVEWLASGAQWVFLGGLVVSLFLTFWYVAQ